VIQRGVLPEAYESSRISFTPSAWSPAASPASVVTTCVTSGTSGTRPQTPATLAVTGAFPVGDASTHASTPVGSVGHSAAEIAYIDLLGLSPIIRPIGSN